MMFAVGRCSVSRLGLVARRCLFSTANAPRCSEEFVQGLNLRAGKSDMEQGISRRLEDMKQNPGLSRFISEKMHNGLKSIIPSSHVYTRPAGLYFDVISSQIVDDYESYETLEEKLKFLETLTDSELQRMLVLIGQKHPSESVPFDILDSLIMECCRRFKDWDAKTMLYTSDILYQIDCDYKLYFRRLISHVSGQWTNLNLSSSEILQLLFYLACLGETSEQLMIKIENALTENVNDFGTEALAILCSAFFVVNRRVKSPELVDWIAKSVLEEFHTLPKYQMNSALKVLRHASYQNPQLFDSLGQKLYDQYKNRNSVAVLRELMEPMRCFSSLRVYNKQLLSLVCDTFRELNARNVNLDGIRSKDFSYLLMALATFNHKPDKSTLNYLADWLRTLYRQGDFDTYPESLVNGVMAFVLMDYFPEDLMSRTLQSRLLTRLRALRHMDKYYQLLIIDASTSIECEAYRGFQLPKGFIENVPKSVLGKINVELEGRAGLHAIYSVLKEKLQEPSLVQCHFILPYFHTASIEFHLDAEDRPMKIPFQNLERDFVAMYEAQFRGNVQQKNSKGVAVTSQLLQGLRGQKTVEKKNVEQTAKPTPKRRIAIEILGWNQVCNNDAQRQLATSEIKQRHLRKLGYEVLVIYPEEAHSMQDFDMERLFKYTEDKILGPLNIQTEVF